MRYLYVLHKGDEAEVLFVLSVSELDSLFLKSNVLSGLKNKMALHILKYK